MITKAQLMAMGADPSMVDAYMKEAKEQAGKQKGGDAAKALFAAGSSKTSAQGALDLPQDFIKDDKVSARLPRVNLAKLYESNKKAFSDITEATLTTLAVRGASAKAMIVNEARRVGTSKPKWAGFTINLGDDATADELTWPRMCAIITLWAGWGLIIEKPEGIKVRGAMSLAMTRVADDRFNELFEHLLGPGYHFCGGALFNSTNPFGFRQEQGDVGRYLAGGLLLDYLIYTTNMRKKGGIAANFPDWVATQPDVPAGGILQKCIICTVPDDDYQFPSEEGDAMALITQQEIMRVTGGKAHSRASHAFEKMKAKIFKS